MGVVAEWMEARAKRKPLGPVEEFMQRVHPERSGEALPLPKISGPKVPGLDTDPDADWSDAAMPGADLGPTILREKIGQHETEALGEAAKGAGEVANPSKAWSEKTGEKRGPYLHERFDTAAGGAAKVIRGVGRAAMPFMAPAAGAAIATGGVGAAVGLAGDMAAGIAAGKAAGYGAKALGAGEGLQDLVEEGVGNVVGVPRAVKRVMPFQKAKAEAPTTGPKLSPAEKDILDRVKTMEEPAATPPVEPTPAPAAKPPASAAVPAAKGRKKGTAKAGKTVTAKPAEVTNLEDLPPNIAMERMSQNQARIRALEEQVAKLKQATAPEPPTVKEDLTVPDNPNEGGAHSISVVDAVKASEPAEFVPVSMRVLREKSGLQGPEFDREILAAADRNEIELTTHDHGGALTPEQRAEMGLVQDEKNGKWYTAATRREPMDPPPPPASAVEPVKPPAAKKVTADTPAPDLEALRAQQGMKGRPVSPVRAKKERGSFSFKPVRDEQLARFEAEDPEFAKRFKTVAERTNLNRMNMSEPELRNFVDTVYKGLADKTLPQKTVEHQSEILARQQVLQDAAKLGGPDLVEQVAVGEAALPEGIDGRAITHAIRERVTALNTMQVDAIQKLHAESQKPDANPEVLAQLEKDTDVAFEDAKKYLTREFGIKSDAGRNLAAMAMLANKTTDPVFWVQQARKAMGLPPGVLPPDAKIKEIYAHIAAIKSGDAARVEQAKIALAKSVANMRETGLIETISILRNAGLLTGPRTHVTNFISNAAFAATEEAKRVPAALADAAMAGVFGRDRSVQGANVGAVARAIWAARTKGVSEAKRVLAEGSHAEHLDAGLRELNYQGLHRLADRTQSQTAATALRKTGDAINFYGKAPFRALSAADRIFKAYHHQRALESAAWVQARQDAKAGLISADQIKARAAEIVEAPPKWMDLEAKAYAEFATFNNPNVLAKGIGAFERTVTEGLRSQGNDTGAELFRLGMRTVVPFRNTPSNIVFRILWDYSGLAATKEIGQAAVMQLAKQSVKPEQQKAIAEAFGRGAVGVGLAMLGYSLAADGKATPVYNNDRGEQGVDEYAGRQSGAVKIGGMWHRIMNISPVGNMVALGATLYHDANRSDATPEDRAWSAAGVATRTVSELPMMQGTKAVTDFMMDPGNRAGQFVSGMAGSFVPTIAADAATLIDPTRREYKPGKQESSITHGVKYRMPFLRSTLAPARDVLGDKLPASRLNAINPLLSQPAKEDTDPLASRLIQDRAKIAKPTQKKSEDDDLFRARKFLSGVAIKAALNDALPELDAKAQALMERAQARGQELSLEDAKRKAISDITSQTRREVTGLMNRTDFRQLPAAEQARILQQYAEQLSQ